jgi:acetyl esterase/lipase
MAMDADFAARLREVGNDLPAVAALFAPLLAAQDRSGVIKQGDLAYGPHERHRLDLYRPDSPDTPANGWPVVMFFHGGGFIRGSKEHRDNLGWFLARQGYIAVLPNYRLAPESRWPCGPQDVVAVWSWVRQSAPSLGGDPSRTVLVGESAGAAHVAAAVLRKEFHPVDWNVCGAVLLSGPYNARLEGLARAQFGIATPDPRNEAYFGPDPALWDGASTVDHVTAPPLPLLISYAELDPPQMQVQAGELFARLVSRHGFAPDLLVLAQHNHFSQGFSFGTSDTTVSDALLGFLGRVTATR